MKWTSLMIIGLVYILQIDSSQFTQPLSARRVRNKNTVKERIVDECEKLLTFLTSSITSLSKRIDVVAQKMKQLITDKAFFSGKKAQELEAYRKRLKKMRERVECLLQQINTEMESFENDFCNTVKG